MDLQPARVLLLTRRGCHLCEQARDLVRDEVGETPWQELDVDADPALSGYSELVPVVLVDGFSVGQWRIRPGSVRRAVAAGGADATTAASAGLSGRADSSSGPVSSSHSGRRRWWRRRTVGHGS